jgi:hypothetical protein
MVLGGFLPTLHDLANLTDTHRFYRVFDVQGFWNRVPPENQKTPIPMLIGLNENWGF